MKKIVGTLCFAAIAFSFCFAKPVPARPATYSVTQISGPSVVIPGLDNPVAFFQGAVGTIQWKKFDEFHGTISTDASIFITDGGVDYLAYDLKPPSNCPPLEVCDAILFFGGSINIPALLQSLAIDHELNGSTTSRISLTTNASQYRVGVEWFRNNVSMGGGPFTFIDVVMPGVYSAKVSYSYNGKTAAVTVGNTIVVAESPFGPKLDAVQYSYNPVIEPVINVTNSSFFGNYEVRLQGTQILFQTHCTSCGPISFNVTSPGTYQIGAIYAANGVMQYTDDIVIANGELPEPKVVPSAAMLTYETPQIQLTAGAGTNTTATYNAGYQWYFNNTAIPTATQKTITVFKPGEYKVIACAKYPDNSVPCKPSQIFTLTGEPQHVSFVRTKIPLVAKTLSDDVNALQFTDLNTSTSYFDGIARPIQQVLKAASPAGNDILSFTQYDAFGREPKKFLPFTRPNTDGSFLVMPQTLLPLTSFYSTDNDNVANTTVPFGEVVYESSPLNRIVQQGSAGEDWQISNGHAKSIQYSSNGTTDNVLIWNKTQNGVSATNYYPVSTLTVTGVTDEDGKQSREYKDKDGRVVLSERIIEDGAKLRTYFVFDDLGRLQFVLPPKTISELPNSSSVSIATDVLARECYSYQYDERNRVTVKNIPAAGSTYIIYDQWDRIVLTQQANQRSAGKWTFNKYDGLDRVVMTGEISLSGDYSTIQQAVSLFYASVSTNPLLRYEELNGNIHGYTNRSFPVLSNQLQVYAASYYDNYNFLSQLGAPYQFKVESTLGVSGYSTLTQSLATGTKVLILGTQTYLKTINFYDDKHRLIQSVSDNHQGGVDRTSFAIDFVGRVTHSKEQHNGLQPVTIDQEFSYDHRGRETKAYHTINGGTKVLLAEKNYNELGQLIEENLHSTDGNTFLQSQDYAYNIRGWLVKVNPIETESNVQFQDQYGFELSYTSATGISGFQPAFNGNITAFTEIRPGNIDVNGAIFKNGFSYQYDSRNQLTNANYFQIAGPGQTPTSTFDLTGITYDPNGNIKSLKRKGITSGGTPGTIDDLNYNYNGNQLIRVDEGADKSKGYIKK